MDFKLLAKAISVKFSNKKKRFKGATKSYVSLFLVVIIAVASTTAWLSVKDKLTVNSPEMEMRSATGIQDSSLQVLQTEVVVENFRLEEASSVDGRNIFFPTSYINNVNDADKANITLRNNGVDPIIDWSTTNSSMDLQTKGDGTASHPGMRFREANAGDKNVNYAYADAQVSSSGAQTDVWIKGYKIKIGDNVYEDKLDINSDYTKQNFPDPYTCPVRIAIIDDSGHKPKVFDPSARIKDQANNTMAVLNTKDDGTPTTHTTDLDAFSSYYYGTNNPLFTVPAGKTINLSVVAWLEGTHPYAKDYQGQEMTFSIEIETNVSQMEEIYLHDWTIGDEHDNPASYSESNSSINDKIINASKNWTNGTGVKTGQWLSGSVDIAMQYFDTQGTPRTDDDVYKTTVMTKLTPSNLTQSDIEHGINPTTGKDSNGFTVFRAAIPKYTSTTISFYRLSTQTDDVYPGTVFNSWHTYSGVNSKLSSTAKNWRMLGNLAETRKVGSTESLYTHYYAIRGNGYGNIPHDNRNIPDELTSNNYVTDLSYSTTETKRYSRWLSPCIGYWGNASGPVKR